MKKAFITILIGLMSSNVFGTPVVCTVSGGDGSGINFPKSLGTATLNEGDSKVVYQTADRSTVVFAYTSTLDTGPDALGEFKTINISVQNGNVSKQTSSVKFGQVLSINDFQRDIGITCFPQR